MILPSFLATAVALSKADMREHFSKRRFNTWSASLVFMIMMTGEILPRSCTYPSPGKVAGSISMTWFPNQPLKASALSFSLPFNNWSPRGFRDPGSWHFQIGSCTQVSRQSGYSLEQLNYPSPPTRWTSSVESMNDPPTDSRWMYHRHSNQMSQRSQVSWVTLWECSPNVFDFVIVIIVFFFLFWHSMSPHHSFYMYQWSQVSVWGQLTRKSM